MIPAGAKGTATIAGQIVKISDLAKSGQPRAVRTSEMTFDEERLRMDDKLAVAALGHHRLHALRGLGFQRTARGDDGNAHAACLGCSA